jgi:hypothetical protein
MSTKHLAIAGAVLAFAFPAAANAADYADPAGDNGPDADIGAVSVTSGSDGYVHVRLTIANMPALTTPGSVVVGLDTDRSASTGSAGGADYLIIVILDDASSALAKWDGSTYGIANLAQGDLRYLISSGSIEFLIRPAAIGNPTSFGFWAAAATGDLEEDRFDRAPDSGNWLFEPPPPPPPPPAAVTVEAVDVDFLPAAPRAGRLFRPAVVRIELSNGKWVLVSSYRCVATLGGRPLIGKGRGGCTFALPKKSKGKRLVVTLFVTYKGGTDRFDPYTFRVR